MELPSVGVNENGEIISMVGDNRSDVHVYAGNTAERTSAKENIRINNVRQC